MKTRTIDDRTISAVPEEPDDLLSLRRVISPGDRVTGETTRVIKREREYARPDRGERIRIRLVLNVESVSLDSVLDRLRIRGTILESSNEEVAHGSHHSLVVRVDDAVAITKKRWSAAERRVATSNKNSQGFVLVAIETSCCGIGRLSGTHLRILPNIYSGYSGKRYKREFNPATFYDDVADAATSVAEKGDKIVIFGPGEEKKKFANRLRAAPSGPPRGGVAVADGIDTGGEDGVYAFTRSDIMKEIMTESKLAKALRIVDEIVAMASRKERRFSMGYEETKKACEFGAADKVVFSEKAIQAAGEEKIVDLLNELEAGGADALGVDSSTDVGLRVSGLGGIVSTLRFPVG